MEEVPEAPPVALWTILTTTIDFRIEKYFTPCVFTMEIYQYIAFYLSSSTAPFA